MAPLLFGARGIVPIGYAAFAFVLGVTVGMLVRRTVPAMAITLAVFVAVQIAMPLLVRPHLIAPVRSTFELTPSNLDGHRLRARRTAYGWSADAGRHGRLGPVQPHRRLVRSRRRPSAASVAVPDLRTLRTTPRRRRRNRPRDPGKELAPCLAEIKRLGYRQQATYHPAGRFWPFQWYETGIYPRSPSASQGSASGGSATASPEAAQKLVPPAMPPHPSCTSSPARA